MIKKVVLFQVYCDLCGKLFDNEEPKLRMNECHLYTSVRRAEIGIEKAGWRVLHNQRGYTPREVCTDCKQEAANYMQRKN